jgi:hypothetical protein
MSIRSLTRSRPPNRAWNGRCRARPSTGPAIICAAALGASMLLFSSGRSADVSVLNGDVELTISSATAGQEPDPVTDQVCQLQWSTLVSDPTQKITVRTNLASPGFGLVVRAVNVSAGDGTAAGDVSLSTTATDFIVDIPSGVPAGDPGTCTVRYTASSAAADGTGSDIHTITFTIVNQ